MHISKTGATTAKIQAKLSNSELSHIIITEDLLCKEIISNSNPAPHTAKLKLTKYIT